MPKSLSAYEQGAITTFNKADDIATIITYEQTVQKHLERRLGLTAATDSGFGTLQCCLYNGCLRPYN